MTSRDPDNEAFERFLAGDDELATGYANAATDAPDALLDARVRKAARAAAKGTTATASPWSGTIRNLAALAAVIVVTVGLLASLSLNQTAYRAPASPRADHTADGGVQSTVQEGRQERVPVPPAEPSRSDEPQAGRRPQAAYAPPFSIDAQREAEDAAREAIMDVPAASAPRTVAPDLEEEHRTNVDGSRPTYAAEADAQHVIDAENAYAKPSVLLERKRESRPEMSASESPPAFMAAVDPMRERAHLALRAIHELLESGDMDAAQERWRAFQRDYPEFPSVEIKAILKDYRDLLDAKPRTD